MAIGYGWVVVALFVALAHTWHGLAIEARADHLQVFWDGKPAVDANDDTFRDAGKVGLWTKADSVTYFDALTVTPLG